MKTLNKNITKEFFDGVDGYVALQARWREIMNDRNLRKTLRCEHHLLYQMLRGKDWHRALTAPTNARKLENGAMLAWKGRGGLSTVQRGDIAELLLPFAGSITGSAVIRLRARLPEYRWDENPLEKEPYID